MICSERIEQTKWKEEVTGKTLESVVISQVPCKPKKKSANQRIESNGPVDYQMSYYQNLEKETMSDMRKGAVWQRVPEVPTQQSGERSKSALDTESPPVQLGDEKFRPLSIQVSPKEESGRRSGCWTQSQFRSLDSSLSLKI